MVEMVKEVNIKGDEGDGVVAPSVKKSPRLIKQEAKDAQRKQSDMDFQMRQKVTQVEHQQLIAACRDIQQQLNEYKAFVKNIFYALAAKEVISFKDMDEVAKEYRNEEKEFTAIQNNKDLTTDKKVEAAKEKGLSPVFIEMLETFPNGLMKSD